MFLKTKINFYFSTNKDNIYRSCSRMVDNRLSEILIFFQVLYSLGFTAYQI